MPVIPKLMNNFSQSLLQKTRQSTFVCKGCGKCITTAGHRSPMRLFCTRKCGSDYRTRGRTKIDASTGTVGAMSEFITVADLLGRKFMVFKAASPSCPHDLVVMKDEKFWTIGVRTGHKRPFDSALDFTRSNNQSDAFAICTLDDRRVRYVPVTTHGHKMISEGLL